MPPEERLGETALCGTIEVPENWAAPEGRSIGMSYVVLKSTGLAPFSDPVIYFQGGPGGSGLNSLALISSGTSLLRENRDVIVFDARGTAHSNALYCPIDLQITDPEAHDENIAAADARIDALGVDAYSDPDAVFAAIDAYWQSIDRGACVPYLEGRGIDLSQYDTANTVRDTIALMRHLGYPGYNLFGGSYGSTLALATMEHYTSHPDTAADLPPLRSVVLDGVAPRNREHYEEALTDPRVILRVFDDCAADEACARDYPDIRDRAIALLAELHETPLMRDDGGEITAKAVADVMRSATTSHQGLLPYLPRLVDELERGETGVFDLAGAVARFEVALPGRPDHDATLGGADPTSALARIETLEAQFDAIKESLSLDLLSGELIREAILKANTRPELFIAVYDSYLELGGGTIGNVVVAKLEPYIIHRDRRTRAGLVDFVTSTVSFPALQGEMLALVDGFSDDEIATVFTRLTSASFDRGRSTYDKITHRVVSCNDAAGTMFNDRAFAAYRAFEAPQLIGVKAYMTANYQISCQQLGLATEAYVPAPPGVVSDVPTLLVNGALDNATPAEWGYRAAETLSDATVVTLPMAGHTAGLLTPCGNALVQAFILDPAAEPNLACAEAERPVFVGPDEDLPG